MKPFTKLFSSIVSSSIWRTSKDTKVVWITMLAMCDKEGEIWASVGGLADMARVTKEECQKALTELESPDDDSRTKLYDGRRIEPIDGGWRILNYKKYRELGRNEDRREYFAEQKAKKRAEQKSTLSTDSPQSPPIAEEEAKAEEREKNAPAPVVDEYEQERKWLESLGAITRRAGECIISEWKAVTKRLKVAQIEEVFRSSVIQWPSEFKAARKARGI